MLAGLSQCCMVSVPPGFCARAGPAPATAARTALAKTTILLPNIMLPPARGRVRSRQNGRRQTPGYPLPQAARALLAGIRARHYSTGQDTAKRGPVMRAFVAAQALVVEPHIRVAPPSLGPTGQQRRRGYRNGFSTAMID